MKSIISITMKYFPITKVNQDKKSYCTPRHKTRREEKTLRLSIWFLKLFSKTSTFCSGHPTVYSVIIASNSTYTLGIWNFQCKICFYPLLRAFKSSFIVLYVLGIWSFQSTICLPIAQGIRKRFPTESFKLLPIAQAFCAFYSWVRGTHKVSRGPPDSYLLPLESSADCFHSNTQMGLVPIADTRWRANSLVHGSTWWDHSHSWCE
jgi:hypothetical protein